MVEESNATGDVVGVVVGHRRDPGAKIDVARTLRGCGQEHLGVANGFPTTGVVLANPDLVVTEPVEGFAQVEISLVLEGEVLADGMVGSDENAESARCHAIDVTVVAVAKRKPRSPVSVFSADDLCPCGSADSYQTCCGPRHDETQPATTAEQVMRARYSAHVVGDLDYLRRSWHPDTCPEVIAATKESERWLGLEIRSTERGGALDGEGLVEFVASFQAGVRKRTLHERSRFVRLSGRWVYIDGELEF
jgi:SEC-C motif-containing protein